ncbi:MAG: hypothetical protein A6D92_10275 [Symbiobacterium thermophilum]|uniref:DUF1540 domain-containing protein n=1 Tax=Symbiobacterium thermophilum TaxID=2734 RepID=A0A1Y2T3M0_SYMTR|nr:MAG: hypothetical protein A6D92_10275 [Symbiobacterium thermophilum]
MASQHIRCTVSSCYYYAPGDNCAAEEIMVRADPTTIGTSAMEVGDLGAAARESNHTLCETFIPQKRGPKPGIRRLHQ